EAPILLAGGLTLLLKPAVYLPLLFLERPPPVGQCRNLLVDLLILLLVGEKQLLGLPQGALLRFNRGDAPLEAQPLDLEELVHRSRGVIGAVAQDVLALLVSADGPAGSFELSLQ